jgi:hypothetical protein
MTQLRLKLEDVALRRKLSAKKLRSSAEREQEAFRRYAVAFMRQKALDKKINFKGRFIRGITADRRASLKLEVLLYNRAPHAIFVEMGRRAGARRPPFRVILSWVQAKFGLSGKAAIRVAWAVVQKIHYRGIRKRPVLTSPTYRRQLSSNYAKRMKAVMLKAVR